MPAAGIVLADPLCGSGTLLIEAALMATNTAPGLLRSSSSSSSSSTADRRQNRQQQQQQQQQLVWPFEGWHDFQHEQWQKVLAAARLRAEQGWQQWREMDGHLLGNDVHEVMTWGCVRMLSQHNE